VEKSFFRAEKSLNKPENLRIFFISKSKTDDSETKNAAFSIEKIQASNCFLVVGFRGK